MRRNGIVKRRIVLLAILAFSLSVAFASDNHYYDYLYDNSADDFRIYGYIDGFTYLTIAPLSSASNPYTGMPFDLLGSDVAWIDDDSPLGRIIAYWSLIVNIGNRNWTLKIKADPLTKDRQQNQNPVYYHLTFYTDDVGEQLKVHSSGSYTEFQGSTIGVNNMIVVDHRQVRFMIDQTTDLDTIPSGDYYATVYIELIGL